MKVLSPHAPQHPDLRGARRRSGLWVEIALALALITLMSIILNAGVFWLWVQQAQEARHTDLILSLSHTLRAQLAVAASEAGETGLQRVLDRYGESELRFSELYVVDAHLRPMAVVVGEPPTSADLGLRSALYAGQQHAQSRSRRVLAVTTPIVAEGRMVGALRVALPIRPLSSPFADAGVVLTYTALSGGLVAFFGFVLFQRRLLRPIEALRAGTARIAAGEFGHQVELDAARELQGLCVDLNRMSASLAQQLGRLELAGHAVVRAERLAGVGRLAAGIAHEVGNPLAAVSGYAELLEQGLGDPAVEADLIHRMREELDRIDRIIRGLLSYARPGAAPAESVLLQPALEGAAEILRMRPEGRAVTVHILVDRGLTVWVAGDVLRQVLLNVLVNAAQAGAGRVWLRASGGAVGERVDIFCEDDGAGFSEEALERAIEPFFTTKDIGEGTGMGLAISVQLIEAAGGGLTLGNRPEGGARIWLRLPKKGGLG